MRPGSNPAFPRSRSIKGTLSPREQVNAHARAAAAVTNMRALQGLDQPKQSKLGRDSQFSQGILSGSTKCIRAKGKKSENRTMQDTYHKGCLPWCHTK